MASNNHVRTNQASWDRTSDEYQQQHGAQLSTTDPGWGPWQIPERELQVLGDVRGKDVLEFGCGGAQWSICLARMGARPIGLDLSARQLQHARRFIGQTDVEVPLVLASAEDVPLRSAAFDIVFCDYGAMTFADPERTVPEAARLLRAGGLFAFSTNSPILKLCWPGDQEQPSPCLTADYFTLGTMRIDGEVEFQLPYGAWIRLFRRHGLIIEGLIETRPAAGAASTYRGEADRAWARRWPAENIWKLRKS